jgi:hypothetical protein
LDEKFLTYPIAGNDEEISEGSRTPPNEELGEGHQEIDAG